MSDNHQFDQDDLALFAMQLLPREEEMQVRELLESSADLRQEFAETQGDLAIYATTVEMHMPPAPARDRLMAQIGRERKVRPTDQGQIEANRTERDEQTAAYGAGPGTEAAAPAIASVRSIDAGRGNDAGRSNTSRLADDDLPRETSGIGRLVPWIGWAVAAGLAVTTGNFYHESEALRGSLAHDHADLARLNADAAAARELLSTLKDPTATRVTLTRSKEAPVPQGKVTYVADKGSLLFVASNLAPLDPYKVYELWLIPANGQAPVAAGTFHPDARGNGSVVLPKLPVGLVAKAFGVTVEDEGGSTTPTMPILLSGAAAGA